MSANTLHPRRRALLFLVDPPSPSSKCLEQPRALRKGATFHSPTSPTADLANPVVNFRSLPRRSPTCPRSLEDLVAAGARPVTDVDNFPSSFARSLARESSTLNATTRKAVDPPLLPGSSRLYPLNQAQRRPRPRAALQKDQHHHGSDSGLGTSISGASGETSCSTSALASTVDPFGAITRSFSTLSVDKGSQFLSDFAVKHIKKEIIDPVLAAQEVKDFHPIARDLLRRIGNRNITCLRDLEKTLLLLAPVSSSIALTSCYLAYRLLFRKKSLASSKKSYLSFCELSVQCIHTTVGHLNDVDLRRPTDRPYTNTYFLDLFEQVRSYANMVVETQKVESVGTPTEKMDCSPFVTFTPLSKQHTNTIYRSERLRLHGGLSRNGHPAEIVREKDGSLISLKSKSHVHDDMPPKKRSLSGECDHDDTTRSMARRKKGEIPGLIKYPCPDCKTEFVRQCDLSKHVKKHTRPHKCPSEKCQFHSKGFTTEKERDRHFNDKHNADPTMYACHYKGCSYKSKRESNCKQHMEKTHGWHYDRQKSNGRKRTASRTPQTPALATPVSITQASFSPDIATSPAYTPISSDADPASDKNYNYEPRYDLTRNDMFHAMQNYSSAFPFDEHSSSRSTTNTNGSPEMTYASSSGSLFPQAGTYGTTVYENLQLVTSASDDDLGVPQLTPHEPVYTYPASGNFATTFDYNYANTASSSNSNIHKLSPNAQPDICFTPAADVNEGFAESFQPTGRDFPLFGDSAAGTGNYGDSLFDNLDSFDTAMDGVELQYSSHHAFGNDDDLYS